MSYSQCMHALSDKDVFRGLLGYGLFAETMPKIFSSVDFLNFCETMPHTFQKKAKDYIRYESVRNTNVVRMMGIPNPFVYYKLCSIISKYWVNLLNHFDNLTINHSYKVSRIHVRKHLGSPKIFTMSYNSWSLDDNPEADLRIGARYAVNADISNFFPSISTHSIPWAIAGKPYAKKHRKYGWINELDIAIRGIKDDETNGILIGPHASNLISEIILTRVDQKLMETYSYQRNIDDYKCYVESIDTAEKFIFDLRAGLKEYDLYLNDKKTKIVSLPESIETEWTNRLRYETPKEVNGWISYREVQRYFDLILVLMNNNNDNASILKFALKILQKKKLNFGARLCSQKFFLQMAVLYPYLYPYLDDLVFDTFGMDPLIIQDWCNEFFCSHYERGNYEAIAYMLSYAISYNFQITDFSEEKLIESPDCLVKTLGFLYAKKFFKSQKKKRNIYENAKWIYEKSDNSDQYWLYWYTVLSENDLLDDWKYLKKHKISFTL